MLKKVTILLVLLVLTFSSVPVYAAGYDIPADNNITADNGLIRQQPVLYKSDLFVTKAGGVYQVGFTTIKFPKNFIDADKLPIVIHVEISSVNGVAGIEFSPDIPSFNQPVIINVMPYKGLLFDKAYGVNIWQRICPQRIVAKHFSRYAFS